MINKLLKALIEVSEKSANIARLCRENEHLFSLLVEEKSDDEKNQRFLVDFKTLADVLIQETIKHDIGKLFPVLHDKIKGEESSKFTNALGESITVEILETMEDTADRLEKVLVGDKIAGRLLATEVHNIVTTHYTDNLPELNEDIDFKNLGIWVDPIDATAEYIKGGSNVHSKYSIALSGLECVTILIGVYDCNTGVPIIGIVNQPFYKKSEISYESKLFWGCSFRETKLTNVQTVIRDENHGKIAILSPSENKQIINFLEKIGYEIVYSSGAGHKILKMITGEVDLYLLSKPTTFKWDTCGPHSILLSQNYHLVDLIKSFTDLTPIEVSYKEQEGKCNKSGVLAYKNDADFENLKELEVLFR